MKTTTTAWLRSVSRMSPEQILTATADQLVEETMFTQLDMANNGYTKLGTATIEFELIDRNTMIDNKIVSLRAQMQEVKAESQKKIQDIAVQIQNLLAIEGIK